MEKHFFAGATTPLGFRNYFGSLIEAYDLKKLYILKGGSGVGKSTMLKKFGAAFPKHNVDYIHCASDPDSLDGVIVPDKRIAMIDGTAPHVVEQRYPALIDEIVDLSKFIDVERLKITKPEIDKINKRKAEHYARATEELKNARNIHLELEKYFSGAVDFEGVNKLLSEILAKHV